MASERRISFKGKKRPIASDRRIFPFKNILRSEAMRRFFLLEEILLSEAILHIYP